jgi:hypothetical protein
MSTQTGRRIFATVVLLVICVSDLYKEWLFMNRREALMAAAASIAAAVVAIPSVASADPVRTDTMAKAP